MVSGFRELNLVNLLIIKCLARSVKLMIAAGGGAFGA